LLALAFTLYPAVSLALKPGEVSLTEERRAGLRAIAAMDHDEKVRNPDYLAEKFLPPEFWFFGLLTNDYTRTKEFIDAQRISAYYTANAMTWHIDGILRNMAESGMKQVVHIGAGFDSRPYRFGNKMTGVRFFELDQPATQNQKKKMVSAVFGKLPANVTYIPFDYRSKPVFDALKRAGYNQRRKTLFIWEGTTMLTDRAVVGNTLRSIAKRSGSGSEVVFDYVFDAVVKGDFSKYRGARYEVVESAAKGEPWKFGIAQGQAAEFVARRGLDVISDLGAEELAGKYLVKSDGSLDGKPTPYYRIIHAVVRK
jgi:methyltransferase (TIGR00027 family)